MGIKETMLSFAEKLGDTIDKGINVSKDSYNKITEKTRIKKEITRLNTEIDNIFASVGRKLFNEEPENEKFKTVFGEVTAKEAEIAEFNKQLSVLEGAVPCPSCGAVVQKDDTVCSACGAKLKEEVQRADVEIVEVDEVICCKQCGVKLDGKAKFCDQCGAKVD